MIGLIAEASAPQHGSRTVSLRERALQKLWGEGRLPGGPLPTDVGPLQVVFRGWENSDSGPDFRNAILARADGRLVRGDIEIHVHPREWLDHGHHQDPAYDGVVLQVVWRADPSFQAVTSAGKAVPAAALEPILDLPLEVLLLAGQDTRADPRPCVRHAPTPEAVAALLDAEGDARFLAKSAALAGDAAALGAEQALYEHLMEALGYSKNRAPFKELAQRLPFAALAGMAVGKPHAEGLAVLEKTLLAEAGKLTAPWQTFRVRPSNSPKVRLVQAAQLVQRFAAAGLVEGMLAGVGPQASGRELAQALMALLPGPVMGQGRALVNVVLPFLHGWASERRDAALASSCLEAYRAHPKLESNRTIVQMAGMLLPPEQGAKVIRTARRQQGLLQLYKQRCMGLLCEGCSLGNADIRR